MGAVNAGRISTFLLLSVFKFLNVPAYHKDADAGQDTNCVIFFAVIVKNKKKLLFQHKRAKLFPVLPVYLALADGFIICFRQLLHAFIACLTWTIRNNPHYCLCGCSRVEAKTVQHIAASLRKGRLKPKYLVITLGVKVA